MKARTAYIKEHYLKVVEGDLVAALLLDRLVYYSQQNDAMFDLIKEEIELGNIPKFKYGHLKGWVKKSANYLADSLLIGETERTVQRKLEWLAQRNLILRQRAKSGTAYQYRPNFRNLESMLAVFGFKLDGNSIEEETPKTPATNHEQAQADAWESIPGASDGKPPAKGLKAQEWHSWAAKQPTLDHAPDEVRRVSYLISTHTGFEPDADKKNWIAAVTMLWQAAGKNEEVLVEALKVGQVARMNPDNGLTFSGPRSYMSYARDQASRKRVAQQPIQVESKTNGKTNGVIKLGV